MMNEFVSSVRSNLESISREGSETKSIECQMRLCEEIQGQEDGYATLEVKKPRDHEKSNQIVSLQNKNSSEIFDLSFVSHYLVLISSNKRTHLSDINKSDYKNEFSFVGYLDNQDNTNSTRGSVRIMVATDQQRLKRYLKKEWSTCYIKPIEKITTFIRLLLCSLFSELFL